MRWAWGLCFTVAYLALAYGVSFVVTALVVSPYSPAYGFVGGVLIGFGAVILGLHHGRQEEGEVSS